MRSLTRPVDSIRWNEGSSKGHVESFFLKANDPRRHDRAFWLKFTLLVAQGGAEPRLAEVWGIRFDRAGGHHRAARESFAVADCRLGREGLGLDFGGNLLEPGRSKGAIGQGDDRIEWDLTFDHAGQEILLSLPNDWMYDAGFPKSKTYTSCPRTRWSGTLSVGGEAWEIDAWPGMLGHNWGLFHNPQYHWAQCSLLGDGDSVFEGFSARIPLGPVLSPWLTMATLRHEGQEHLFNRFRSAVGNQVEAGLFAWSFVSRQRGWQLEWNVSAPVQDFVGLEYLNPDGTMNYCLNSKIADCSLRLARRGRGRWEEVATLRGDKSCAYEILTRDPEHGVRVLA